MESAKICRIMNIANCTTADLGGMTMAQALRIGYFKHFLQDAKEKAAKMAKSE